MTTGVPSPLNYFTAPPQRRARFVAWVVCVTVVLAGNTGWVFFLRDQGIFKHNLIWVGWLTLGAVVMGVGVLLKTTPPDALRLSARTSWWLILSGTALLQLLAVTLLAPALSDDVLRYRIDGVMWLNGNSPYVTTPIEYVIAQRAPGVAEPALDGLDLLVPHKQLHTIYPPAAQVLFAVTRAVEDRILPPFTWLSRWAQWRAEVTRQPRVWQALLLRATFALGALGSVLALLSILAKRGHSPWYAVLLAWNPLFVIETGGMGHVDIVGVLFVLLAIRALQGNRPILATAMLALAAGVKPHVVLLAPFLLRDAIAAGYRMRARWLAVAFISILALVYSPMLYQQGYKGWFKTARVYANSWEANGSIYDLVKSTADETDGVSVQRAKDRARLLAGAVVVATMLLAWFARADLATAGYWVFLVALLFSPVVYPWYLLWVLGFVPLLRGWQGMTALVWSATVGVSYLLWRTSDWVLPTRWLLVEYVPVYATLAAEVAYLVKSRWRGSSAHVNGEGSSVATGATASP